jgi:NAD(P)-dependent dehydrogenase (short-subunit alcohol dehydrogenase family)
MRATMATRSAQRVPAGPHRQDEDMAGAAVFLASRAGDYVVGETLWWTAA